MTARDFYDKCRNDGKTQDITSNENPDYSLPFYQSIFTIMEEYFDRKGKVLTKHMREILDRNNELILENHKLKQNTEELINEIISLSDGNPDRLHIKGNWIIRRLKNML